MREISDKNEMAAAIHTGITKIADIVGRTLGPGGLPILIERFGNTPAGDPYPPLITKDGVTVAEECQDEDPRVDLVIQSVKAICRRTNKLAGDGTTTAIVLGKAILDAMQAELTTDGNLNPQILREEVEASVERVITELRNMSIPVEDLDKVEQVATISANGDKLIGQVIRKAFDAVGVDGSITVEEGSQQLTTIETVEGFQIARGAEGQDRFFNNPERTRFEAKDPIVVLFDGDVKSYTELHHAIETILKVQMSRGRNTMPSVVFVANNFSPDSIQYLLVQRVENGLQSCAVKSPHMTNIRTGMLDDMAVMLGGYRLGGGNREISSSTYEDFGSCSKVVVEKYRTTFYEGDGEEVALLNRIDQLKAAKAQAESPYDASNLQDRISALSNGIAKIAVGGLTEFEMKERYHRIEDALNSARVAVDMGVIPGGGLPLLRIARRILAPTVTSTRTIGDRVLYNALHAPFRQILENIRPGQGAELAEKLMPELMNNDKLVYDARNRIIIDAFQAGILDAVKVTISALSNATSIAALLSTCGGAIYFKRETK